MQCLRDPFAGCFPRLLPFSCIANPFRLLNLDFLVPTQRAKGEPAGHQDISCRKSPEGFVRRIRLNCWRSLCVATAHPAGSNRRKGFFICYWCLRQATAAQKAHLKG